MAEEKPFEATSQRLNRAKREGDLPRSADLNAFASLAAAVCAAFLVVPFVAQAASAALERASRGDLAWGPYAVMGSSGLAVCAVGLLGALLSTYLQSRQFTFKMPAPSLAKLDPFAGVKKMISADAIVSAAKATLVTLAIAGALMPGLRDAFSANAVAASPLELAAQSWHALLDAFLSALAVAAFFAIADLLLEQRKWKKRLRMSFDEVKRDAKSERRRSACQRQAAASCNVRSRAVRSRASKTPHSS